MSENEWKKPGCECLEYGLTQVAFNRGKDLKNSATDQKRREKVNTSVKEGRRIA